MGSLGSTYFYNFLPSFCSHFHLLFYSGKIRWKQVYLILTVLPFENEATAASNIDRRRLHITRMTATVNISFRQVSIRERGDRQERHMPHSLTQVIGQEWQDRQVHSNKSVLCRRSCNGGKDCDGIFKRDCRFDRGRPLYRDRLYFTVCISCEVSRSYSAAISIQVLRVTDGISSDGSLCFISFASWCDVKTSSMSLTSSGVT